MVRYNEERINMERQKRYSPGGLPGSSHAETTLASRRDILIFCNVWIVQCKVDRLNWKRNRLTDINFNLVWYSRAEKGRCSSKEEGKEKAVDNFLHGAIVSRKKIVHSSSLTFDTDMMCHEKRKNEPSTRPTGGKIGYCIISYHMFKIKTVGV